MWIQGEFQWPLIVLLPHSAPSLIFFKVTFGQLLPDKKYWSLEKRTLCVKNFGLDDSCLHSNSSFKSLLFILRQSQIAIDKNANAAIPRNLIHVHHNKTQWYPKQKQICRLQGTYKIAMDTEKPCFTANCFTVLTSCRYRQFSSPLRKTLS